MSMPSTLPDAVGTHARETNASRCVTFLEVTEDKVRPSRSAACFESPNPSARGP